MIRLAVDNCTAENLRRRSSHRKVLHKDPDAKQVHRNVLLFESRCVGFSISLKMMQTQNHLKERAQHVQAKEVLARNTNDTDGEVYEAFVTRVLFLLMEKGDSDRPFWDFEKSAISIIADPTLSHELIVASLPLSGRRGLPLRRSLDRERGQPAWWPLVITFIGFYGHVEVFSRVMWTVWRYHTLTQASSSLRTPPVL